MRNLTEEKRAKQQAILAAVEFGFKSCEKGNNLEATLAKAKELL